MVRLRASIFDLASFLVLALGLITAYSTYTRLTNIELEANLEQLKNDSTELRENIRNEILEQTSILRIASNIIVHDITENHAQANWPALLLGIQNAPTSQNDDMGHKISFIAASRKGKVLRCHIQASATLAQKETRKTRHVNSEDLCANRSVRDILLSHTNPTLTGVVPWSKFASVEADTNSGQKNIYLITPVFLPDVTHYSAATIQGWVLLRTSLESLAGTFGGGAFSSHSAVFYELIDEAKPTLVDHVGLSVAFEKAKSYPNYSTLLYANGQPLLVNAMPNSAPSQFGKRLQQHPERGLLNQFKVFSTYAGDVLYEYKGLLFYEAVSNFGGQRYLIKNWQKPSATLYPAITTIGIALISCIISLLFMLQSRTRARAEEIAIYITQKLRDNEDRLRAASEGGNDGLWDWNIKENTIWLSKRYYEILGYKDQEIRPTASTFEQLVHPDDRALARQAMRDHLRDKKPYNVLLRMAHKDGGYRWIRTRGQARYEDGRAVRMAGVHTDVTEEKEYEIELASAREKAESAARVKADFLANMSHEIRTPLNGIIGIVELLRSSELPAKFKQYLNILQTSSQSLLDIINDILDFSKLEAGQMRLEIIDFNLHALIADIIELMRPNVQSKTRLELIFRFSPHLPKRFLCDPTRIRQIILNLLSNAIKFTQQGYVFIDVDGEVISGNKCKLRIAVEDTGIGIDADKIQLVFQKFTQEDNSTTRQYGGTGLGLSIVREISALLGGEISVSSEKGKGTRFELKLTLPIDEHDDAELPENITLQDLKLLVVDDNIINCDIVAEMLRFHGIHTDILNDPKMVEAHLINATRAGKPYEIALLDFHMPGLPGDMLGKIIKANPLINKTHLIMFTSMARRGDAAHFKDIGFEGYLQKPMIAEHLFFTLGQIRKLVARNEKDIFITRHHYVEASSTLEDTTTPTLPKSKQPLSGKRVLIVEDNPTNQYVMGLIMESFGLAYSVTGDGKQALHALESDERYDVILMDCQMPEMDGYQATRAIRARKDALAQIPIIALTANTQPEDKQKCLEAGMDAYLPKPINKENLRELLTKHLAGFTHEASSSAKEVITPSTSAHIDEKRLLNLTQHSAERIKKFLTVFEQTYQTQCEGIEAAIAAHDQEKLNLHAHTLKGACMNVYATRMANIALAIEAVRISDTTANPIANLLAELHEAFAEFKKAAIALTARL